MPAHTYRFGYATTRLTEAELETIWTWALVHPELRRRLVRMFDHHPTGDLGCGSGARDPISQDIEFRRRHFVSDVGTIYYAGQTWRRHSWAAPFAPPGGSNHEDDILDGYALAVDVVGWEDHWFDRNCHLYGIKNFGGQVGPNVNGEEWHAQPAETANSRRDVNTQVAAGLHLPAIALPGDTPVQITPPLEQIPDPEEDDDMQTAIAAIYQPIPALIEQGMNKSFALLPGGDVRHAAGPDAGYAAAVKLPVILIGGDEHYNQCIELDAVWRSKQAPA